MKFEWGCIYDNTDFCMDFISKISTLISQNKNFDKLQYYSIKKIMDILLAIFTGMKGFEISTILTPEIIETTIRSFIGQINDIQ